MNITPQLSSLLMTEKAIRLQLANIEKQIKSMPYSASRAKKNYLYDKHNALLEKVGIIDKYRKETQAA